MPETATLVEAKPQSACPRLKLFTKLARELGLHVATLGRWRAPGILRDGERVRLWAIRVGGRWMSSDEAVAAFIAALNAEPASTPGGPRSPAARSKAVTSTDAELDALGV
jgi:hypothetical protein